MVEPKIATARILADLNLAVRYRIAICIYASRKFGGCNIDRQTTKFSGYTVSRSNVSTLDLVVLLKIDSSTVLASSMQQ